VPRRQADSYGHGVTWDAAREKEVDRLEEQLSVFHRGPAAFLRSFASRVHPG